MQILEGNDCQAGDVCIADSGNISKCCQLTSSDNLEMYINGDHSNFSVTIDKKMCVDIMKKIVLDKNDNDK